MESIPTRKNHDGTLFVSQQWAAAAARHRVVFRISILRLLISSSPRSLVAKHQDRVLSDKKTGGDAIRRRWSSTYMIVSYAEVINRRREEEWFFPIVSSSRYQNKRDSTATEYVWLSNTLQLLTPRNIVSLHHIIIPVSKKTKEKEDDNKIIIISSSEQEAVMSKR